MKRCYQTCLDFTRYLDNLRPTGLQILTPNYQTHIAALAVGKQYHLLPTDALHVATCHRYSLTHIATADAHFQGIPPLQVWTPAQA